MKSLKCISASFFLLIVSTLAVHSQTYQPITVTGLSHDVVANGSGSPAASTNQAVDNNSDVLFVNGYQCSPNSSLGLPLNGFFTSAANVSINYQFASYDANNALYLPSSFINTLNLAQPKQFVDLSFLAFSTEGNSTMTIKLNFTDGSFSGAYPFTVNDWFSGPNPAISSIGRINNGTSCLTDVFGPGAPYMYDHLIHLSADDQQKFVQSITITNTSGNPEGNGNANGRVLVMAVSGAAGVNTPALTFNSISATPETCPNVNNGRITVNYSGGTLPYTLIFTGTNQTYTFNGIVATSYTLSNLAPALYNVKVRDANNNEVTNTVIVNAAAAIPPPVIVNSTGANVICSGSNLTLSAPASGKSLRFTDGSFVEAASTAATSLTTSLTVEAWVKTDNAGATQYIVSKGNNDQAAGQYGLVIVGGRFQFHLFKDGQFGVDGTTNVQSGVWYHVAGTWDGATITLYVNGIAEGSNSLTGALALNNTPLQIGRLGLLLAPNFLIQYQFYGEIDEVRIWNTGKTSTEIVNNQNLSLTTSASLVANYTFNEGSGTTTADLANGNTATLASDQVNFPGSTIPVWTNSNATINYQFYSWSGGQTTPSVSITSPGTYSVSVTDANGCSASSAPIIITDNTPNQPVISSPSNLVCSQSPNTLSVSNVDETLTYQWKLNGVLISGATGTTYTATSIGDYKVVATNAAGCSSESPVFTIFMPDPFVVSINQVNQSCAGYNSGFANVAYTGGKAPYTVAWSDGNQSLGTSEGIGNLPPGNYTVTATDACGEQSQASVTITRLPGIVVPNITASGPLVLCPNSSLTLSFPGVEGYTWVWTKSIGNQYTDNYSSNSSITVTESGNYGVYIQESNGCRHYSNNVYVFPASSTPLTVNINAKVAVCSETQKGDANATSTGGNLPITFLGWTKDNNFFSSSNYINSLDPGTYTASFVDVCGNTVTNSVTIVAVTPVALPTITASGTTTLCSGTSNTLTVSQGQTADLTYRWYKSEFPLFTDSISLAQSITVNSIGYYNIQTLDKFGCYGFPNGVSINPPNPTPLTVNITSNGVYCGSSPSSTKGYASAYTSGGNFPITFLGWTMGGVAYSLTSTYISNLTPGTYTATYVDVCGNTATNSVTIVAVTPITVPTITASGSTTLCSSTTSVTLTASQGQTADLTYRWYKSVFPLFTDSISLAQSITVNSVGYYNIQTLDKFGCYGFPNGVSINPPTPTPLTVSINSNGVYCTYSTFTSKGYANVYTSGGNYPITFLGWTMGGVSYNLTSTSINNLNPGTYTATYVDACGNTASNSVTIVAVTTPVAIPTITASGATNLCSGASVTLTASQGQTADLTYRWARSIPAKFYDSISLANSITVTDSGSYSIQTKDKFGCMSGSGKLVKTYTNPAPAVYDVSSSGILCASSTAGQVLISGSETGTTYQSYLDGITPRTSVQGTGSSVFIPSVNFSSAGLYTVRARNNTLGCESLMNGTFTVNTNTEPIPTITASGPTTFCQPSSVTLTSSPATSYLWSNGATTQSITVNNSGFYSVATTNNGCTKNSLSQSVVGNASPDAPGLWTLTGNLSSQRVNHTATVLTNGKVLVVGGIATGVNPVTSAEIYDPALGNFTLTDTLRIARDEHRAVLLADGRVLIAGGTSATSALSSSEIYDPATDKWTMTGAMNAARYRGDMVLLPNGKVLMTGGLNTFANNSAIASSELFDPATGTWSLTGAMTAPRAYHSIALLNNGKVMVTGGYDGLNRVNTAEIFDPASGSWSSTASMNYVRYLHSATLLANGKLLVIGGLDAATQKIGQSELYDPATGLWAITGTMNVPRYRHSSSLLSNGQVLVSGGSLNPGSVLTGELYNPATGNWQITASLTSSRSLHATAILSNGQVMVSGGSNSNTNELYTVNIPITISGTNAICVNATTQLTSNTAGGVWSAINPAIATVNAQGLVTGVSGGSAKIGYTVTNVYGCSSTYEYTVIVKALPTATTSKVDVVCIGSNTGSITVNGLGGTAPYQYSNDGGETYQTSNIFSGLSVGNYSIFIKDVNSCPSAVGTVTIIQVDNIVPTITCPASVTVQCASDVPAVNIASVAVTDNCSATVSFVNDLITNQTAPNKYTITRTYKATDPSGNFVTCTQIITVNDNTAPIIICPSNQSLPPTGTAGAIASYTAPVSTDNCSGTTTALVAGLASGSVFPIGINTVTYRATDASGNTAECSFTITVSGLAPVIVCPANITVNNSPGQCGAIVTFAATENVGSPASTITYSINPGSLFPIGTTTVTATATNAVSSSVCSFTVTVTDNEKPVFNLVGTGTRTINIPSGGYFVGWDLKTISNFTDPLPVGAVVTGIDLTYTAADQGWGFTGATNTILVSGTTIGEGVIDHDLFPGGQTFNLSYTGSVPGYVYGGNNTVNSLFVAWPGWSLTWLGGTMKIHYATSALPNITMNTQPGNCGASVALTSPTVADNCGVLSVTNDAPEVFQVGNTLVTWTATDTHNNTNTITQVVTVIDNELPTISCPAPVTVKCSANLPLVTIASVTASDNCSAVVSWVGDVISNQTAVNKYTITRNYRATDPSGNFTNCSQIITVNDDQAPVFTNCPSDISVSATGSKGAKVNYTEPAATDNCSGVITVAMQEGSLPGGSMFPIGITTVTYRATDASGNTADCSFTITVVDVVAPVIKCIPSITQNTDPGVCGAIVNFKLPVAKDNTSSITVNVTEGFGDGAIEFITPLSNNVNSVSFVSSGDYQDIAHGHGISINVNVELFNPSTNAWTLIKTIVTGTDDYHFGGTAIEFPVMSQVSKIRFTTSQPIFAGLHLYQMDINLNSIGLIQIAGLTSGSLFPVGVTNNVFEATDGSGNKSTCSFDVTVLDREKPVMATVPSITKNAVANCFWNGSPGTLSIQDACTGSLQLSEKYFDQTGRVLYSVSSIISGTTYQLTPRNFPVGKNKAEIIITDANGNESEIVTFGITIIDNVNPAIITTGDKTYGTDPSRCGRDVVIATPVVTDNCTIRSIVNNINGFSFINQRFNVGATTVIWTATDNSGNTTTATQTITIVDTEKPSIVQLSPVTGQPIANSGVPGDIIQTNDAGVCGAIVKWPALIATDPCGAIQLMSTHQSGQLFPVGVTTVTYSATDLNGNTNTASFTVTVTDNEAPKVITRNISVALVNGVATITPAQINNGSFDNCTGALTYALSKTQFTCANVGANQVTLNVTDANNNTAGVTATVTVIGEAPVSTIVVTPSNNTYTGGVATNLYLGYGPQSVTLTNNVTGTASKTYSWTGPAGLSCTSCAAPVFTPTVSGNYHFIVTATNDYGCSASSAVDICVQDIRVPGSPGSINICRLNLSTGLSTTVVTVVGTSTTLLSPTTLDKLGACNMAPCSPPSGLVITAVSPPVTTTPITGVTVTKATAEMATPVFENKLSAKASPNPSSDAFTIIVTSRDSKTPVHVRMLDGSGRVTETRNNVALSSSFKMGAQLIPGMYYAEVIQGKERVVLKLIKQNR